MKAVVQNSYGSIENLRVAEVEKPLPEPGEVLVKVRAASVHPDVWHVVSGHPRVLRLMGAGVLRPKNPIPGTDMAGVVEAAGEGVEQYKPGDEVFGETIGKMQWVNGGAYAEYVAVNQDSLALKPGNVSFEQAASVPTAGYIVYLNLEGGRAIRSGMDVLVNGAGGGVGSLALQMIKALHGRVTAVDHTTKLEMLRNLGADEVIDYTREDFTRRGVQYDIVFDIPGNFSLKDCLRAVKSDGRYIPIGHDDYGKKGTSTFGQLPYFLSLGLRGRFQKQLPGMSLQMPEKPEVMKLLRKLLAEGQLTPLIAKTFPLNQVQDAIRLMVDGNPHGKVMLAPWKFN